MTIDHFTMSGEMRMDCLVPKTSTFGPYIDGRAVKAYGHADLPGWAWETMLVHGEPGTGAYMTLPRAAALDHPWLGEHRNHPMIKRYGA